MENRQGIRRPALGLLKIRSSSDQEMAGLMYNASSNGMFILSTAQVEINKPLEILFNVSVRDKPRRITGIVMHRNKNGFGIIFRSLDSSARLFVNNILSLTPGDGTC